MVATLVERVKALVRSPNTVSDVPKEEIYEFVKVINLTHNELRRSRVPNSSL